MCLIIDQYYSLKEAVLDWEYLFNNFYNIKNI